MQSSRRQAVATMATLRRAITAVAGSKRGSLILAMLSTALLCGPTPGVAADAADARQHAHVHGVATLGIAIDADVVTIRFESPLDSVVGFEHRARTPAERAGVEALQARLKAPADLFRPSAAAGCTLRTAEATSAIFDAPGTASPPDEHADLDATFDYRCDRIDRLVAIETGLFDAFPRLQRIAVEVATGKGQFRRDLKRPARTIGMSR